MSKDNDKTLSPSRYAIIYYDLCRELAINYKVMCVLDTMMRFSKRNVYSKGIVFLSDYLGFSRNAVYKYLDVLKNAEHVSEEEGENGVYFLNADLQERVDHYKNRPIIDGEGGYLKIYHELRTKQKIGFSANCLLYLYYSFSKKMASRIAYCDCSRYLTILGIEKRRYYKIKEELKDKNLIEDRPGNAVKLMDSIYKFFYTGGKE